MLSVIGAQTDALLRSLTAPTSLPSSKSLEELTTLLKTHFEPTPLVIAERFHFYRRNQARESRSPITSPNFVDLRHMAALDDALRHRLVCGLRHESIQKRLLSEAKLTLKRVMKLSQSLEAADKSSRALRGSEPAIKQVATLPSLAQQRKCSRCARSGHEPKDCRFRDAACLACGKKGHVAPACRMSTKRRPPRRVKHLQEESQDNDDTDNFYILKIGSKSLWPITVDLLVNAKELTKVDTGACVSIISETTV